MTKKHPQSTQDFLFPKTFRMASALYWNAFLFCKEIKENNVLKMKNTKILQEHLPGGSTSTTQHIAKSNQISASSVKSNCFHYQYYAINVIKSHSKFVQCISFIFITRYFSVSFQL